MKKPKESAFLILILIGAFIFVLGIMIPAHKEKSIVKYSVTVSTGGHDYVIQDYESNGVYYLFVPSVMDLGCITIEYEGKVADVTGGIIDENNKSVVLKTKNGKHITVTYKNGSKETLVVMQSSIPSLLIDLKNVNLSDVHRNKDNKYEGNSVYLFDERNENNAFIAENCVEFKGRGNSSWNVYEKKAYQIKFPERVSVLGMKKAQKWTLLANASDPSMIKNKTVYDVAKGMNFAFVPDCEYADLWIDGDYRGTYLITEKVEFDENRLIPCDDNAVLVERDNAFYQEDIRYESYGKNYYVLKDSIQENGIADFEYFKKAIDFVENAFLKSCGDLSWDKIQSMLDVESFAQYYVIEEYFQNNETLTTSFFLYMNGPEDVIHAGPIWDFDTCMETDKYAPDNYYIYQDMIFRELLLHEEFKTLVNKYVKNVKTAEGISECLYHQIKSSADMNYIRWAWLGTKDLKNNSYAVTYEECYSRIKKWMERRASVFSINNIPLITMSVSDDYSYVDGTYKDSNDYTALRVAIWSELDGQDDLNWYSLSKSDDLWNVRIPLKNHMSAGRYSAHIYSGDSMIAYCQFIVDQVPFDTYLVDGLNYSFVFDSEFYLSQYPNLKGRFGDSETTLFNHFLSHGMREGKRGCKEFDPVYYKNTNPDLESAFGTDWIKYYQHYISFGRKEGRQGYNLQAEQ